MGILPMTCENYCLASIIILCNTKVFSGPKPFTLSSFLYSTSIFKPGHCLLEMVELTDDLSWLKVKTKYLILFAIVG